jgi:TRAP-type C4-dicarboxylate transport system substrate-binding protein
MMKRFSCMVLALVCLSAPVTAADPVPLTVVSFSAPDSAHGRRWVAFENEVNATLGDQVELAMLTGGQVGNEDNMLSSLRRGRAQMGIISIGALSALVPELSILAAPFLFESNAEADFIMDEVLFEPYAELLADRGIALIKWEDGGWHNIFARKPLRTPSDLKDYRLRSSATDATRLFLSAFGADVVVLDFGDMVSALETGLVDGGVTTSIIYRVAGLYEDAQHYTLTRHAFSPGALIANKAWTEDTPPDVLEKIFTAHGTADGGRKVVRAELEESEAFVRASGVNMVELTADQRRLWTEAVQPVTEDLIAAIGGESQQIYDLAVEGKKRFKNQAR